MQESFTDLDDYLRSLEMVAAVRPVDDEDLTGVVQLLAKTNPFHLTTRRHTLEDVLGFTKALGSVCLTLRLKDRFGDHGLVAVMLAIPDESSAKTVLRIDTWLMSCRVIGRTAEQFCHRLLNEEGKRLGYRSILGEYIPTKKKALLVDLYDRLGFRKVFTGADGQVQYELEISEATVLPETFIAEVR